MCVHEQTILLPMLMKKTLDPDPELCYNVPMNEDNNYVDFELVMDRMEYLEKMGDAHDEARADREKEEPVFYDHFQTLLRTIEKTR